MTELLTAAQMRAIEAAAIASGEVTGLELMERAGRGVVEAIFEEWPEMKATSHRAVVLCGPGNNGGDGFVVARLLKDLGWEVEVFLYGDPERMPPDARVNYERWRGMAEVSPLDEGARRHFWMFCDDDRPDLWIDAIFGAGLNRSVAADVAKSLIELEESFSELLWEPPGKIVAIDVPSGLESDSGVALLELQPWQQTTTWTLDGPPETKLAPGRLSRPLRCDLTVSFHAARVGHFLGIGPLYCGKVVVRGLGLRPVGWGAGGALSMGSEEMSVGSWRSMRLDKASPLHDMPHKYTHGHALILSGPPGRTGAARLAARGALRIGAGLVTIGAASEAIPEHAAHLDAIMLREAESGDGLRDLLADKRINALCLGPGLGLDEGAGDLIATALAWQLPEGLPLIDATDAQLAAWMRKHGHRPKCVLDADALTLLARDPALFGMLHDGCVLTPHAGEFARLFPDIAAKLDAPATTGPAYSKVDATREAAARAGCVVLFKGPDTVIAHPDGRCAINSAHYDRAAPWLATAGSGDVLSGFITGLLARGFQPMQAAETAAWLHVECALTFGPGLIAEDLPEQLPAVFRKLGL